MIKVEVIERFNLGAFKEIKNIKRASLDIEGQLFVGDIFECTKEMSDYLLGGNSLKKSFVKVIEIIPDKIKTKEQTKKEEKPKKTTTKKTTKKTIAKK